MNDLTVKLLAAIASAIGILITMYVIPFLRAKIGNEKFNEYLEWAKKAVECAEMIFGPGEGAQKKAYCIEVLTRIINSKKEIITAEQLEVIIEAAVKEMHIEEEKTIDVAKAQTSKKSTSKKTTEAKNSDDDKLSSKA